jgi:hypothetical protein
MILNKEAFGRWVPARPTVVFDTYWRFAVERQSIFFKRLRQQSPPWTKDPILLQFKFTNAYRVLDRVSQFLIRNVIYGGKQTSEEIFFRVVLFKLFNKIETWKLLSEKLGEVSWVEYSFAKYDKILSEAMENKSRIYSAAYIMPTGCKTFGYLQKHRNHLRLLEKMMEDKLYAQLEKTKSMRVAFELFKEYPTIGDFLAYQFVTDINYSEITNYSEMEFVVPGPGARDGIRKCFLDLGGLNEVELIKRVAQHQEEEFKSRSMTFQTLLGRPLQLIDCQNLFCEVDKYARVAHPEFQGLKKRTRIKQTFTPNPEPISYWFPPKWGLDDGFMKMTHSGENT